MRVYDSITLPFRLAKLRVRARVNVVGRGGGVKTERNDRKVEKRLIGEKSFAVPYYTRVCYPTSDLPLFGARIRATRKIRFALKSEPWVS